MNNRNPKTVMSFAVDSAQRELLVKLSDETKVPMSEFVREGVTLVLEKHGMLESSAETQLEFKF